MRKYLQAGNKANQNHKNSNAVKLFDSSVFAWIMYKLLATTSTQLYMANESCRKITKTSFCEVARLANEQ